MQHHGARQPKCNTLVLVCPTVPTVCTAVVHGQPQCTVSMAPMSSFCPAIRGHRSLPVTLVPGFNGWQHRAPGLGVLRVAAWSYNDPAPHVFPLPQSRSHSVQEHHAPRPKARLAAGSHDTNPATHFALSLVLCRVARGGYQSMAAPQPRDVLAVTPAVTTSRAQGCLFPCNT